MWRCTMGLMAVLAMVANVSAGAAEYFTETTKDFGPAPIGPVLTHYFAIKNTTTSTVRMGTPRIGCGCVSATLLKPELAAGESTYLVAYMDTKKIPLQQRNTTKTVTVSVPFLNPVPEEIVLRVTTVGREDLFYSQESFSFGTVNKGAAASANIKVTLYNNSGFSMKEVTSTGQFVKVEFKEASRQGAEVSYNVTAKLDADCPAGNWVSEIELKTNTPGLDKLRIPVSVNVVSPIAMSPGELKFGDFKVGDDSTSKQVLLQSTKPFKVLEVKGADASFTVTPITDGSRKDHMIRVALKTESAGDLNRQIQIITDSKEMPTIILAVSALIKK